MKMLKHAGGGHRAGRGGRRIACIAPGCMFAETVGNVLNVHTRLFAYSRC